MTARPVDRPARADHLLPQGRRHRSGHQARSASARGTPLRVAVIGVGSGTLTCAAEPGESWTFFEIDQTMVDTARDPKYFSYIRNCMPDFKPVIGDARLTFAREPDGLYDLIIVDAYSSDAIPIHLATKEAMAIYKAKLAPQGAVVMHVSNRHLSSKAWWSASPTPTISRAGSMTRIPAATTSTSSRPTWSSARARRPTSGSRIVRQVGRAAADRGPAGLERRLFQHPRRGVAAAAFRRAVKPSGAFCQIDRSALPRLWRGAQALKTVRAPQRRLRCSAMKLSKLLRINLALQLFVTTLRK